jgi:hypothetical protein
VLFSSLSFGRGPGEGNSVAAPPIISSAASLVLPELIIPESYNLPAFLIQPNRSLNIIFIPFFMLTTIQFNGSRASQQAKSKCNDQQGVDAETCNEKPTAT